VALGQWYRDHLGVDPVQSNYDERRWRQEAGPTVFAPFPENTDYFGEGGKDRQSYPNGRFARLYDPEGNPVELLEAV
jgi:glyoxylase I family protein